MQMLRSSIVLKNPLSGVKTHHSSNEKTVRKNNIFFYHGLKMTSLLPTRHNVKIYKTNKAQIEPAVLLISTLLKIPLF